VLCREDFCVYNWEDTVMNLMGMRFNGHHLMLYTVFCQDDLFMFDGCEDTIVSPIRVTDYLAE
jgi:hypothetical protein